MYLQKIKRKKTWKTPLFCILKTTDEKSWLRIRIRTKMSRIRGSGSVPKFHGSTTLACRYGTHLWRGCPHPSPPPLRGVGWGGGGGGCPHTLHGHQAVLPQPTPRRALHHVTRLVDFKKTVCKYPNSLSDPELFREDPEFGTVRIHARKITNRYGSGLGSNQPVLRKWLKNHYRVPLSKAELTDQHTVFGLILKFEI